MNTKTKSHQRKCWDCGNVATHESTITPGVLCTECGSQDTRRLREGGDRLPYAGRPQAVFACDASAIAAQIKSYAGPPPNAGTGWRLCSHKVAESYWDGNGWEYLGRSQVGADWYRRRVASSPHDTQPAALPELPAEAIEGEHVRTFYYCTVHDYFSDTPGCPGCGWACPKCGGRTESIGDPCDDCV